jgi:hypothetical protein
MISLWCLCRAVVVQLVEKPHYKLEGHGFKSRWHHWFFFNLHNSSSRTMCLGLTQPLTEMSTRNLPGGKSSRPKYKADNLTAICPRSVMGIPLLLFTFYDVCACIVPTFNFGTKPQTSTKLSMNIMPLGPPQCHSLWFPTFINNIADGVGVTRTTFNTQSKNEVL